jgi:ADP-ribose pyrophosphatase
LSANVDVLRSEEIFRGRVFRVALETFRTPSGKVVTQEIVHHPGAAVVVPILPDGRLLLVRQYRHAARAFFWEVPAGRLEPGEPPEACAARELREETGYRADRMVPLGGFHPAPGYTSEFMHLFLAEGLVRMDENPSAPDEDEEIEVRAFPADEVRRRIATGEIGDGKTIIALARIPPDRPER